MCITTLGWSDLVPPTKPAEGLTGHFSVRTRIVIYIVVSRLNYSGHARMDTFLQFSLKTSHFRMPERMEKGFSGKTPFNRRFIDKVLR